MAYRCTQGHGWCTGCNGGENCDELDIIGYCEACGDGISAGEALFDYEGEYIHADLDCLCVYWAAHYRPGE